MAFGCIGRPLKQAYTEYSQVYGDALNQQLLLNLARLSQDEPPYFVQLGQISAQYAYSASAGFGPSAFVNRKHPGGSVAALSEDTLTLGASIAGGVAHTPTFQFVPLNGDQFAQAINSPIPDKLFYTLYDQGFHADHLTRTTVTSIRFLNDKDEVERVLVNHPRHETYPEFLKFCAQLTEAQTKRLLIVQAKKIPSTNVFNDVKLGDVVSATSAGFTISPNPNPASPSNSFQAVNFHKEFRLEPASTAVAQAFVHDPNFSRFAKRKVDFQMRTFISALYAAAKEESYFSGNNDGITFTNDAYGRVATLWPREGITNNLNYFSFTLTAEGEFTNNRVLPETTAISEPIKVRPILTLTGYSDSARASLSKVAEIRHHGQTFTVGDIANDQALKNPAANKSVFTLLSYLFSQISIDPQKLPVQQFIQVR